MKLIYLKEGRKYGVDELRACIRFQLDEADDDAKGIRTFFEEPDAPITQFFERFRKSLNDIKTAIAGDGKTIARKLKGGQYVFRYVGLYDYVDIGKDQDKCTGYNLTFFFMPKFIDFNAETDYSGDVPEDGEDDSSLVANGTTQDALRAWKNQVDQFASNKERNAVLLAIDRYNKEINRLGEQAEETKWHEGLLELAVRVLRDYLENGVYTKQQRELEHNGQGEIDWETTIDQYQPVFLKGQDGRKRPVYMDTATELANSDEDHYVTRLHKCLITTWGRKLEDLGLSSVLRVNVPLLTEDELSHLGTKEYQLDQIRKEMGVQFVTKSRHTLSLMKELIERMSESQSTNDLCLSFGMNGAEHLWEAACAEVLGSELKEPIKKCGLEWTDGVTFRDYMPRPIWKQVASNSNDDADEKTDAYKSESEKSGWKLDFIRTWKNKEDRVEKMVILDAKYYDVSWVPPDRKPQKIQGQPGIGDIAKQIFYQMAFANLVDKQPGKKPTIVNAFLFPEDDNSKDCKKDDKERPTIRVSESVCLGWKNGQNEPDKAIGFKDANQKPISIFGVRLPGIELLRRYASGEDADDWFKKIVADAMWSKTKQVLEGRLAEDLRGRVKYSYAVYRMDGKCPTECQVLSILVDGEPWFHTDQRFWDVKSKTRPEPKDNDIIRETGLVENYWGDVMKYVHQYLNVLSIEEAITHENYFIRLLAVLDARLGKRKIRELADNIDNEPEWFRKWILLRAGE